jgi:hypothetical protein
MEQPLVELALDVNNMSSYFEFLVSVGDEFHSLPTAISVPLGGFV